MGVKYDWSLLRAQRGLVDTPPRAFVIGDSTPFQPWQIWSGEDGAVPDSPARKRPLKAISVGPCMLRGGAEQWLVYLGRFLDPKRVKLVRAVATEPDFVDPHFVEEVPIPVEIGQARAIRRAAKECDVLLCWGIGLNEILEDCRPKLCVFIAHGEGEWTRSLLAGSSRVVDHVVAVSHRVGDQICKGRPTTVICNGVDSARLGQTRPREAVRQSLGFGPADFVLGYVGRFSKEKQTGLIIDALAQLPLPFKAMFVGWGAERLDLMEYANARIPGRHAFVTATQYLGDFYHAMDALCLVSAEEGFSMVLLEAMMCECPAIVTPVGSVPEMIHDHINGIIVDDEPAAIALAAQLLQQHPHWARGVAAQGKAYAQQHGHALRMARQYEDCLEKLWLEKYGREETDDGSEREPKESKR